MREILKHPSLSITVRAPDGKIIRQADYLLGRHVFTISEEELRAILCSMAGQIAEEVEKAKRGKMNEI